MPWTWRLGRVECPLLGVKRTSRKPPTMSAFDPKRTFAPLQPNHFRSADSPWNSGCKVAVYQSALDGCAKGKRRVGLSWLRGCPDWGGPRMCDYSLHSVKSRPAKVGDKLTTNDFGTGTRGFAASEDMNVAICVLPGTELSFAEEVKCLPTGLITWRDKIIEHKTAIFRQINKDKVAVHHDAVEFPDGRIALLTTLCEGQQATVLQLPAEPQTAVEAQSQRRVAYIA